MAIPFVQAKFRGPEQQVRYHKLEERNVWSEQFVRIDARGSYKDYWIRLENYKCEVLCKPYSKLHLEIVREFYVNALPMEGSPFAFKTWVRGKEIDFSRSAINEFHGNPCAFGDDKLDEYHIQLVKGN
ncbi:hypothetical protein RYX36_007070 [Vicia faba]